MNRMRHPAILLTGLLTLASIAAAQATVSPEAAAKISELVERQMAAQKIPAMTVAVALGGRIQYSRGFGMADLENSIPAKPASVFRTASIAKTMTATAVMQLVESGKLDLDAPIQKYCPAFPQKQWPVTARLILEHQSGIRHYEKPGESNGTEHFFTIADSLKIFKDDPLKFEPGTKFNYSTFGYSVLGCAIEGASGMAYIQYLQENIWKPAGMTRTFEDHQFLLIPDRARGYLKMDQEMYSQLPAAARSFVKVGEIYNAQLHDTSMKIPGGGLLSTSEDLIRFMLAVRDGKLVNPATRDEMWTSQKTRNGEDTSYGLGWNIPAGGAKRVLHTGGQAGTTTVFCYWPARDLIIALMMNVSGGPVVPAANAIAEIVLGAKP